MPAWHEDDRFWADAGPFIFRGQVRAAAAEEAGQIISLLDLKPPARILDMPCGVGRHTLELARRGFEVTGVDRTEAYLEEAAETASAVGVGDQTHWIRADMRDFRLGNDGQAARPFDAAINIYTSFGYFQDPTDDRRIALNLFDSIHPGGRLVMEMVDKQWVTKNFRPTEWHEEPDGTLVLEQRTLSPDLSWIDNRWLIIRQDDRREVRFGHRLYGPSEIRALLESVGFTIDRVCGSLSGAEQGPEAPRLVVVARRPPC